MHTPMNDVKEFHDTFAPKQKAQDFLTRSARRMDLIAEEYDEVGEAIIHLENTFLGMTSSTFQEDLEWVAKELADLLYVVYGTAEEFGIPLEKVFKAVHESNMSKVWDDGEVHYNSSGKVMKPPTYSPPDLSFIHEHRVLSSDAR